VLRIRKDDLVAVVSGKDKGKTGRVMKVFPSEGHALVEGINLVKKAKRRSQQDPKGGIIQIEVPIHLSNLMLFDKQANKPVRFEVSVAKDGTKLRLSKETEAVI